MQDETNVRFMLCSYSDEIRKVTILRETPKRVYIASPYHHNGEIIRKNAEGNPVRAMFPLWGMAHAALQERICREIAEAQGVFVERGRALARVARMKKGTVEE